MNSLSFDNYKKRRKTGITSFYTKGQFLDFLEELFDEYQTTSGGTNVQVVCPICKAKKRDSYSKKKLSISVNMPNNLHLVHCWVCGYKSKSLENLIKKFYPEYHHIYLEVFAQSNILKDSSKQQQDNIEKKSSYCNLPKDFMLLATADTSDLSVKAARNYLKARRADSESFLWRWRFGISRADRSLQERIIVPSFDKNGNINYFSARAINDNIFPKYENPKDVQRENIIFNELNINWKEELILVEGVFDLIKCPDNATCLLGSDLPKHFKLFQEIIKNKPPSVVLALDPDALKQSFNIAKNFLEYDIKTKIIFLKQEQKDIGSLKNQTEFNELLEAAIVFNTEWFLKNQINNIV